MIKKYYILLYLLNILVIVVFENGNNIFAQSIINIQKYKEEIIRDKQISEALKYKLKLINLNTKINKWYLLEIENLTQNKKQVLNIENIFPKKYQIKLSSIIPVGIELHDGINFIVCNLEEPIIQKQYQEIANLSEPYLIYCENKIYIRFPVKGRASTKELVTAFLRKYIWGGDQITTFVKDHFYKDTYILKTKEIKATQQIQSFQQEKQSYSPLEAKINEQYKNTLLETKGLGISLKDLPQEKKVVVGKWYQVQYEDGIFVSAIEPKHIDTGILESFPKIVNKLDNKELNALVYLVAFDLNKYELEFLNGTDHPDVGWSPRILDKMKDLADGPDGFKTKEPLVTTGKVPPFDRNITVATFTGGFKRDHAGFRWGKLATINKGSHYGVIENGVIFSSLNPYLATIIIKNDNQVILKTWQENDWQALGETIKHARQNGVPVIDGIDNNLPKPGELVGKWGEGNWSGSTSSSQRALRAGICIQNSNNNTFLIYGYFSSATANAMARVFQAYFCSYALHLDMNALEHTYLALYSKQDGNMIKIEHLIDEMKVLDVNYKDYTLARFLHVADNRDFFYLKRKLRE